MKTLVKVIKWTYNWKVVLTCNMFWVLLAAIGGIIHRAGWVKNENIRRYASLFNDVLITTFLCTLKFIWCNIKSVKVKICK